MSWTLAENQKLPPSLTTEQFFAYLRPLYSTWDRTVEDGMRRRFELQPGQKLGHLSRVEQSGHGEHPDCPGQGVGAETPTLAMSAEKSLSD